MAKAKGKAALNVVATPDAAVLDGEITYSRAVMAEGVEPGTGSERTRTRFIVLYGAPKTRKTTACRRLKRAKWIVSDSNCIPTLDARGAMPKDEDIHEVNSVADAKVVVEGMIAAAAAGKFWVPAVICDSFTQLSDWLQQDVAKKNNQTFIQVTSNTNGWQEFNAEFGGLIDAFAELSRFVNVIIICHAKEKADPKKGDFSGFNLPPQMALKLGRVANWVLYQSMFAEMVGSGTTVEPDEFTDVVPVPGGQMKVTTTIHTVPVGLWMAGVNGRNLQAEEPADLAMMMAKEGLL